MTTTEETQPKNILNETALGVRDISDSEKMRIAQAKETDDMIKRQTAENLQRQKQLKEVTPPTSYATYPGAFYIDSEKKTHKAITNRFHPTRAYVAKSSIHGYGVFANSDIEAGAIIEECSAILLDTTTKTNKDFVITNYLYTWPCEMDDPICKEHGATFFVPTGNALLYNHSDTPNSYWIYDKSMKRIFLAALRDIKENEELTWYYGHGYAQRLKTGDANSPKKGCSTCQQKQKQREEQQKLKDALNIPQSDENFSSPDMNERKKELLQKWIEQKKKEATAPSSQPEFRSMVVPEKKLDDNIQNG